MSANTDAPASDDLTEIDDYERMLELCESLIEEGAEKIESGRIRDEEKERARQGWYRAVANLISEWRKLKEARDLEELTERIEALEETRERVKR